MVILRYKQGDKHDDEHEEAKNPEPDASYGSRHAEAGVFGFAAHDAYVDLVAYSPDGVDGAETCALCRFPRNEKPNVDNG